MSAAQIDRQTAPFAGTFSYRLSNLTISMLSPHLAARQQGMAA